MAKKYNIKWRPIDSKKLSNTVRNYNAKITRIIKKNPELKDYMPPKVTVKSIKKDIVNRTDFNNIIKSLQRFLRKGAEKPIISKEGVKTTAYMKKEIGIKVRRINRKRKKLSERLKNTRERGTYDIPSNETLTPKKYDFEKIKQEDWKAYVRSVEKQARESYYTEKDNRLKQNYLKGFRTVFGQMGDSVASLFDGLPSDIFAELFYYDDVMSIDFIYDPLELEVRLENIANTTQQFFKDNKTSLIKRLGKEVFYNILNDAIFL